LGVPYRPPQRIEDALRGVVDDRSVELVAVPQSLAIQQQIFLVHQQSIVVHQIVEVFGTVEKFVGLHPLRHFQGDGAERSGDFAGAGLRHTGS
jgi:hypothetical protein